MSLSFSSLQNTGPENMSPCRQYKLEQGFRSVFKRKDRKKKNTITLIKLGQDDPPTLEKKKKALMHNPN